MSSRYQRVSMSSGQFAHFVTAFTIRTLKWTLPAGYMELGESAAEGAARETWEEAQAKVEVVAHFAHLDIPVIGQCRAT